jgi:hypothetical protein
MENQDIKGKELLMNRLSGDCWLNKFFSNHSSSERRKISLCIWLTNQWQLNRHTRHLLQKRLLNSKTLETVIKGLDPKDFEVLTDLIFRQMDARE